MTTVKLKFRPSETDGGMGVLYYQITRYRVVRQLLTDYRIFADEWNDKRGGLVSKPHPERRDYIIKLNVLIRRDLMRLKRIVDKMENASLDYRADDIKDAYIGFVSEYSLYGFMERLITGFRKSGRIRTAETYKAAMNSFSAYMMGEDVLVDGIDAELIRSYNDWLGRRGVTSNTVSFYNRILRAVYNRAVKRGDIDDCRPFANVYTGIDKTRKRALSLKSLRRVKALNLAQFPALEYARDIFMLSFYLRGMSFVDLAFLRKSDLTNGYITYRRRKTGRVLTVRWTDEMQCILAKYPANKSEFLLPIIRASVTNPRSVYRNVGYTINRNLKRIGQMAGLRTPLTMYVARHSWASAAMVKGVPVSVISEGMGHVSEATTRIYLASLDAAIVDRANAMIIRSL